MLEDRSGGLGSDLYEAGSDILPCQLRPYGRSLYERSGERLLMLALLSDAINIYLKDGSDRRLLAETRTWISGEQSAGQVISFRDACDALGIDPGALRRRLFQLKDPASRHGESLRAPLMLKPSKVSRGPVAVGVKVASRSGGRTERRSMKQ